MQLLIQRGQRKTKILQRPIFNLWAKFELTTGEASLIDKYHVREHVLVEGNPLQLRRALIRGIIIAGVIAAIVYNFLGNPLLTQSLQVDSF
jgi:hypothetical protein